MKLFFVILVAVVLSIANAQTFRPGKCNLDIATIKDFSEARILGHWYLVQRSYDSVEDGTKCYTIQIKPCKNGAFVFEESFYETEVNKRTLRLTDILENIDLERSANGRKGVTYTVNATKEELKNGKMHVSPGLVSDTFTIMFLATDYDNYALVYSCEDVPDGKVEYAWIITRTAHPDASITTNADNLLKNQNINLSLRNVEQSCKM